MMDDSVNGQNMDALKKNLVEWDPTTVPVGSFCFAATGGNVFRVDSYTATGTMDRNGRELFDTKLSIFGPVMPQTEEDLAKAHISTGQFMPLFSPTNGYYKVWLLTPPPIVAELAQRAALLGKSESVQPAAPPVETTLTPTSQSEGTSSVAPAGPPSSQAAVTEVTPAPLPGAGGAGAPPAITPIIPPSAQDEKNLRTVGGVGVSPIIPPGDEWDSAKGVEGGVPVAPTAPPPVTPVVPAVDANLDKCPNHPTYKVLRMPRALKDTGKRCPVCLALFAKKWPERYAAEMAKEAKATTATQTAPPVETPTPDPAVTPDGVLEGQLILPAIETLNLGIVGGEVELRILPPEPSEPGRVAVLRTLDGHYVECSALEIGRAIGQLIAYLHQRLEVLEDRT